MPDVYAAITGVDRNLQARLADVIEARAADPRQRAMLQSYLSEIEFPPNAVVLEIGCGTGPVSRALARWPGVSRVIGVDPSDLFVAKARELGADIPNLSFVQGDGRSLIFENAAIDVVVVHTTLSHVPGPEQLVAEATRVLRPEGWLAVFDGDYATASVAVGAFDPLEACVDAFREHFVHDPWLVRRLPRLLDAAGLRTMPMRSHGYVEAAEGGYMLSWIDRGADVLVELGQLGSDGAGALKAEARRRSSEKTWFAHIAFASILARKPQTSVSERSA